MNVKTTVKKILAAGKTREAIAVATDSSTRTVERWLAGSNVPRKKSILKKLKNMLDKCRTDAIL